MPLLEIAERKSSKVVFVVFALPVIPPVTLSLPTLTQPRRSGLRAMIETLHRPGCLRVDCKNRRCLWKRIVIQETGAVCDDVS